MPKPKYRILTTTHTTDGHPEQKYQSIYSAAEVMDRKNKWRGIVNGHQVLVDWRVRVREGMNIIGEYITTDDGYILRVLNQTDCVSSHIIETCAGTFDIDDAVVLDGVIASKGNDFSWLEDTGMKKTFALIFILSWNYLLSFKLAYGRAVNPRYYKRIFEMLINDEVVMAEMKKQLSEVYSDLGIKLADIVEMQKALADDVKVNSATRLKAILDMKEDFIGRGDAHIPTPDPEQITDGGVTAALDAKMTKLLEMIDKTDAGVNQPMELPGEPPSGVVKTKEDSDERAKRPVPASEDTVPAM